MHSLRSCLTVLFFLLWYFLPAQIALEPDKKITQYSLDTWSIENGLPSNSVLDVMNSSSGYMWFATFDGLVRFDGIEFRLFNEKTNPSFEATGTLSLFEDHHRNIWIGTNGKGLIKMTGNEFTTYFEPELLASNVFLDIVEDKEGLLWLATRSGVVTFKDGNFLKVPDLASLDSTPVLDLFFDNSGALWIATTGKGLFKYFNGNVQQFTENDGLNNNSIRAIYQNNEGHMILGSNHGTNIIKNGNVELFDIGEAYRHTIVNRIIQDNLGTYWVGTDDGLVKIHDDKKEYLTKKEGIPDKTIQSITRDKEGSLWLGTYRGGIFRLKDGKFTNYGEQEGIPNNIINVAHEEDHIIYVGTDYGLGVINAGEIRSYTLGETFGENRVRDITRDNKGRLWLATYAGLVNFENDGSFQRYSLESGLTSEKVRVLEVGPEGNLWIGTGKGLNILENGKVRAYEKKGLANAFIMSIFKDSKDQVWVGTDGMGLFLINKDEITVFTTEEGLASDVTFQIAEDKNGLIWIGTNNGITVYDNQKFKSIDFKQGLISNSVFQILFDWNNEVWITTSMGLQHFDYENMFKVFNGESDQVENSNVFNNFEGMRSRQITGASIGTLCTNGTLLVPTLKGLTRIDPANLTLNKVTPPVLITEAFLNNKKINYEEKVVIPADIQNIEFHYTGLSLYAPDKVNFRYKLEPFDKEWNDVGTRRAAYYTNIPHGEYTFRVIAANNDGIWNEVGASIQVVKQAYFYQEAWFYGLVILIVALLGYLGYKIRVRSLKTMNLELSKLVDERTRDLAAKTEAIEKQTEELRQLNTIKDKLFSIISHDLKSPLNSLIAILKLLHAGSLKPEELTQLTAKLESEVQSLSVLLTNLFSWAKTQMKGIVPKPVRIDLQEVANENIKLIESDARKKGIVIQNEINGVSAYADIEMIRLVFRNLISNALKFTGEQGSIVINAKKNGKFVQVCVKDNGVGLSKEDAEKLFSEEEHYTMLGTSKEAGTGLGLLLCKEFVDKNGGRIWVESEKNKGSEFLFELPKLPID